MGVGDRVCAGVGAWGRARVGATVCTVGLGWLHENVLRNVLGYVLG